MSTPIQATVWNEYRHEKKDEKVARVYPHGIHAAIAEFLNKTPDIKAATATLDEPEHGLTDSVLDKTEVLLWWGHMAHGDVKDEIVEKVKKRVLEGMGLIVLHSGHYSKIFKTLMGTTCSLKWREADEKERIWNLLPSHPIAAGIPDHFIVPKEEMYGEPFGIPTPDELIFVGWFAGGEVFRSGATWQRGNGRVFYFQPGHETYPTYYQPEVQTILTNAVRWARQTVRIPDVCPKSPALESLPSATK
jgi:trehalose utilization protein